MSRNKFDELQEEVQKVKRFVCIILSAILLVSITGCSKEEAVDNAGKQEINNKEITILMPYSANTTSAKYNGINFIMKYGGKYEAETGTKVKLETIDANSYEDFLKKRDMKLYLDEGPTLILLGHALMGGGHDDSFNSYVESSIALNIKGRIDNQEKLYDSLKDEYFVPTAINILSVPLNREVLERNGIIEPGFDQTIEDLKSIWDKWSENETIYLSFPIFNDLKNLIFHDIDYIDLQTGKVSLNDDEIKEYIGTLKKEIFSGKYQINDSYTYENFYNMIYEFKSDEFKETIKYYMENTKNDFSMSMRHYGCNELNTFDSQRAFQNSNKLLLPEVKNKQIFGYGFIVNRNGISVQEGIDFLNYLLSDEIQFDIYKSGGSLSKGTTGIVNKTIEEKILELEKSKKIPEEAINLRQYMYEQIEKGNYILMYDRDLKEDFIKERFDKELVKIVFADELYTGEEISQMLQQLEDELNIYIQEQKNS